MPEDTQNNIPQVQPVVIAPQNRRRIPTFVKWIFGCITGCLVILLGITFVFALIVALVAGASTDSVYESVIKDSKSLDKIAIIPVSGVIMDDSSSSSFSLDSIASKNRIEKLLDTASNDKYVNAIILRLNTPGGSEQATRSMCTKIKAVAKNKPIYTYIESEGASGGYYMANCTKYIMADKYAITGSIGALVQFTDLQGLMDKLGIKTKTITNTKGVLKESDVFKNNSQDETKFKKLLDDIYSDFVDQIFEGRNQKDIKVKLTRDQIIALGTGEFYYGKEALDKGLVDANGSLDDMISTIITRESLSRDIKVTEYTVSTGFFGNVNYTIRKVLGQVPAVNVSTFDVWAIRQ